MTKNGLSLQSLVYASHNEISVDLRDEKIILDLKEGRYFGLNPVAARIWELIQEPKTVKQIQTTLLDEYDIQPDTCLRETVSFLHALLAKGLIEAEDEVGG